MSRPVFSFRPNLKNPEHEKAWQLLMEIPTGQRNQYLVDVILEQEERGTLKRLIQEAVREELKKWRCGTDASTGKGRNSRSDAGFFISDGARVKGVRPMGKESMALLDMLGFCIHLTWIL